MGRLRGSDGGAGTVGSIFAFPIAIWLGTFGVWVQVLATGVVVVLALWSIKPLFQSAGDAGWIVVDEAAGMFLATVSLDWQAGLVAFVVFRLADIFKGSFPGVAKAEGIPGAVGVTADDLVAGLYGLAAGLLASRFLFAG